MKHSKHSLKRFLSLTLIPTILLGTHVISAQNALAPDQNPNYKISQDKYVAAKDELIKTEGTTVQATYKAIDDMQIKKEQKDLKKSNRQERRLARINNRNNSYYYNTPYSDYYNNSYDSFDYNYSFNNYRRPYGRQYSPYMNYSPYNNRYSSYNNNRFNNGYNNSCGINTINNAALWAMGAYLLLR